LSEGTWLDYLVVEAEYRSTKTLEHSMVERLASSATSLFRQ